VPSYFQSLEHLLRYCARPPFALERLSVTRDASGYASKVRYVLPRHKAAAWAGPGRGRKSIRPGASGVQAHDDRAIFQSSPDELPAIDIHSL